MCSLDNSFTSPVFNDYKVWSRLGSSMVGACEDLKSSSVTVGITQKLLSFVAMDHLSHILPLFKCNSKSEGKVGEYLG